MLYNVDVVGQAGTKEGIREIPFREHSFQVGDKVVSSQEFNPSNGPQVIAAIESIPTGTVTSADLLKVQSYQPVKLTYPVKSHCNARSFEELLGYVDLRLLARKEAS